MRGGLRELYDEQRRTSFVAVGKFFHHSRDLRSQMLVSGLLPVMAKMVPGLGGEIVRLDAGNQVRCARGNWGRDSVAVGVTNEDDVEDTEVERWHRRKSRFCH